MFSFTLDIYCTSVRPGRGIPHMWLSLRFLLSFYLLKGFFSSFSLLLLRVKGRGCHTLLKPYETNCGLWIWAIQIKFDWLIDRQNKNITTLVKVIKIYEWEIPSLSHLMMDFCSLYETCGCYINPQVHMCVHSIVYSTSRFLPRGYQPQYCHRQKLFQVMHGAEC